MFIRTIIFVIAVVILSYFHSEDSHGVASGGGVTVYDFFASWCGPCRADIARDNELSREGKAHFIGVDEDVDLVEADKFIASTRPNFEVRKDPTHSLAASMGAANSTPSAVIVGPKGKKVINGSLTKAALESEIAALS